MFIPRLLAETIWAARRNNTRLHYGEYHVCSVHQVKVDNTHLEICEAIGARMDLKVHLRHLKEQSFFEWDAAD
jgi:aminoglycoside N3'-acetyltransferase